MAILKNIYVYNTETNIFQVHSSSIVFVAILAIQLIDHSLKLFQPHLSNERIELENKGKKKGKVSSEEL